MLTVFSFRCSRVFAWRFTEKHCCWICADLQLVFQCNLHETFWKTFTGLAVLQKTVLCLIMCWTLGQARTRSLKVFLTMSRSLPPDQVNLKLIHVSSKTHEFLFVPSTTVATITQHVYDNWPEEWQNEEMPVVNILRLIYQGRFLHDNVTLGGLRLPTGKTTVMHLVAREHLPEPNSQSEMKKDKSVERGCSSCCSVLWLSCIFIFSQTIYLQNPFQLVLTNSEPGGILQCISVTSDTENVHVRKLWPYNRDCHSARSHTIVICVHVWQMVAQLSDIM